MSKYFGISYFIVIIFLGILLVDRRNITQDRDKYKENTETLLNGIKQYKLDSSRYVVENSRLRLTIDEFKEKREEDLETIKKLNLRVKQLQSVASQVVEVKVPVKVPIPVHVEPIETKPINVYVKDKYKTIDLTITKDSVIGDFSANAKIKQYIYADYKHKFLWWMWGLKGVKQVVICDNPHVNISYSEYLEISK